MDLTPLLSMIPPPWNMVAIFGLGVLAKWLHSRLYPSTPPAPVDPNAPPAPAPSPAPAPAPVPTPAPAPTGRPLLDLLRTLLASLIAQKAATVAPAKEAVGALPVAEEIDPEVEHYKKLVKDHL